MITKYLFSWYIETKFEKLPCEVAEQVRWEVLRSEEIDKKYENYGGHKIQIYGEHKIEDTCKFPSGEQNQLVLDSWQQNRV